jgi:hypothetical protein
MWVTAQLRGGPFLSLPTPCKTVHLEGGHLQRAGGGDELALAGEDAAHPVERLGRRLSGPGER